MIENSSVDRKEYKTFLKISKRLETILSFLCIAGILVCLYALKVEIFKLKDKNYVAYCDIDGLMSCSKSSRYGKGFGLLPESSFLNQPNSIYGLIFYIVQLLLLLYRNNMIALKLKLILSLMANFGSLYLAYILHFILNDFCIVCGSLYLINGLLLIFNYKHFNFYKKFKSNSKKEKFN
ncbi:vitamin K epoxide reductase complex subunit 1 1 [Brachionus plicatilis]|uniref:vitamin-K-epoxide reductase (warfarin-sensitive) n=1 Tax=Brachionus plicatilis TaxID=10195 RepID=A0A3M7RNM5_BRAPC|nr:vitamin K epoxide reductase complex subunit 1 1 [Brachionus plicatilis]